MDKKQEKAGIKLEAGSLQNTWQLMEEDAVLFNKGVALRQSAEPLGLAGDITAGTVFSLMHEYKENMKEAQGTAIFDLISIAFKLGLASGYELKESEVQLEARKEKVRSWIEKEADSYTWLVVKVVARKDAENTYKYLKENYAEKMAGHDLIVTSVHGNSRTSTASLIKGFQYSHTDLKVLEVVTAERCK